jgi:hypothetical protein
VSEHQVEHQVATPIDAAAIVEAIQPTFKTERKPQGGRTFSVT